MIKNMVFDMGNVVVRFDAQRHAANIASSAEDQRFLLDRVFHSLEWLQMDRGVLSIPEAVAQLEASVPPHIHPYVRPFTEDWYSHFVEIPEMDALLARLKQNGYAIYMLSNAAGNVYEFMPRMPVFRHFDGRFVSSDHGLLKPDPRIYQKFLDVFSLKAEECFFVDDMHLNVEGAMHVGFSGYIFRFDADGLEQALLRAGVRL